MLQITNKVLEDLQITLKKGLYASESIDQTFFLFIGCR